ncbi:MAG: hypothetical protein CME06_13320 [Gemmatimonadetes bacterium]|nr:hypothetical protein [Gemmatimonadota bacterium]
MIPQSNDRASSNPADSILDRLSHSLIPKNPGGFVLVHAENEGARSIRSRRRLANGGGSATPPLARGLIKSSGGPAPIFDNSTRKENGP